MDQSANIPAPELATDEPGSSFLVPAAETRRFATAAEEAAYRAGLAERASGAAPSGFGFDPVALRYRADGLTPDKQREYVEALADTGLGRAAADRIGVSEQAINRLRRRADARSFNLACEAARRFGARRLHSTAWERAIEGTIRGHYYHGELKSEERVYDNRLLVYLLGKTERLLDEPAGVRAVADNWQPYVEAIEQGAPAPDLTPEQEEEWEPDDVCEEVWESEGAWWTSWPPPAGFDGFEKCEPGRCGYRRHLSEAEEAVVAKYQEAKQAAVIAERDAFFGFAGGRAGEADFFRSWEAETYETSEPGPEIAEPSGEDDKGAR